MDLRFDGRVAVITGAGAGMGREHALLLASRGAGIVVNDLNGDAAESVVAEIIASGGTAVTDTHSISNPEGGEAVVQTALERLGGIDIVVNNAGIVRDKTFAKMTADQIQPVLEVHLAGAFYVTRPAYVRMKEQGYGRIVSISSAAGLFGNFGQTNYGAAKAGLVGLTRVLALEGRKYGVLANVVAPIAATGMTDGILDEEWERRLRPEFVSPGVAWLAHEDCEVTGEIYSVAGGRIAQVFIGETEGFYSPELTVEDIRDNWDRIRDRNGYYVPMSAEQERDILEATFRRAEGGA